MYRVQAHLLTDGEDALAEFTAPVEVVIECGKDLDVQESVLICERGRNTCAGSRYRCRRTVHTERP